jgi:hypothetical protein
MFGGDSRPPRARRRAALVAVLSVLLVAAPAAPGAVWVHDHEGSGEHAHAADLVRPGSEGWDHWHACDHGRHAHAGHGHGGSGHHGRDPAPPPEDEPAEDGRLVVVGDDAGAQPVAGPSLVDVGAQAVAWTVSSPSAPASRALAADVPPPRPSRHIAALLLGSHALLM